MEPHGCNSIEVQSEWDVVDMAVDSRTTETVGGKGMLAGVEV